MPYNKGDFTQQGINGDVSALVRLNDKRVMKVVLSSDDESDNCDISGKVYDLLNGTEYDIGTGVSGNIEITENGENINVAPYATATVNVSGGGGDFTVAEVILVSGEGTTNNLSFPIIYDTEEYSICTVANNLGGTTTTYSVPLYKGEADAVLGDETPTVTVTGSAEYVSADGYIAITGDCTITLS